MPQMFPLYWLPLFLYFIFILMFFNIKNFFLFKQTPNIFVSKKLLTKKIKLSW